MTMPWALPARRWTSDDQQPHQSTMSCRFGGLVFVLRDDGQLLMTLCISGAWYASMVVTSRAIGRRRTAV